MKEKTIEKLEELKNNLSYGINENYTNLMNICIDYDNDANDDLYLYDNLQEDYNFIDEEMLTYDIKSNANDLQYCKFMLQDIDLSNEIWKIGIFLTLTINLTML